MVLLTALLGHSMALLSIILSVDLSTEVALMWAQMLQYFLTTHVLWCHDHSVPGYNLGMLTKYKH